MAYQNLKGVFRTKNPITVGTLVMMSALFCSISNGNPQTSGTRDLESLIAPGGGTAVVVNSSEWQLHIVDVYGMSSRALNRRYSIRELVEMSGEATPLVVLNGGSSTSFTAPLPAGLLMVDHRTITKLNTSGSPEGAGVLCITKNAVRILQANQVDPFACTDALQRGPLLVWGGVAHAAGKSKSSLHSAIGVDKRGDVVLVAASSASLDDLARWLSSPQIGCDQAMALSGDTDSGMYIGREKRYLGSTDSPISSAIEVIGRNAQGKPPSTVSATSQPDQTVPPQSTEVEGLIKRLESGNTATRTAARSDLISSGKQAKPILESLLSERKGSERLKMAALQVLQAVPDIDMSEGMACGVARLGTDSHEEVLDLARAILMRQGWTWPKTCNGPICHNPTVHRSKKGAMIEVAGLSDPVIYFKSIKTDNAVELYTLPRSLKGASQREIEVAIRLGRQATKIPEISKGGHTEVRVSAAVVLGIHIINSSYMGEWAMVDACPTGDEALPAR